MKPVFPALTLCATLALAATPAAAAPVTTSFDGVVNGYWSLPILEDDFPLGTAVQYSFDFDDAFRHVPVADLQLGMTQAISGWMRIGSVDITLHTLRLSSFGYNAGNPNGVSHYGFRVNGDGPDTDDGEPFSGLWIGMSWDARAAYGLPLVSYGHLNGFVVDNGYLVLNGPTTFVEHATVPLPSTLALTLPLLGVAAGLRRRHR